MTPIPRPALLLGLAGLIPFLAGAALAVFVTADTSGPDSYPLFAPGDGHAVLSAYGTVILCFMSGVLWGFATKAEAEGAWVFYALSVLPALWVFFTVTGHVFGAPGFGNDMINLIVGFAALLVLDYVFQKRGLAPLWWMRLRLMLTAIVVGCLLTVAI